MDQSSSGIIQLFERDGALWVEVSILSDSQFGGEVVGEVGSRLFDHHHRTGRPAKAKASW